jgi:hypothetical protein
MLGVLEICLANSSNRDCPLKALLLHILEVGTAGTTHIPILYI